MSPFEWGVFVAFYLIGGTITVGVAHRLDPYFESGQSDARIFILWPLFAVGGSVYLTLSKVYRLARGSDD